jgi:hypothetical protein
MTDDLGVINEMTRPADDRSVEDVVKRSKGEIAGRAAVNREPEQAGAVLRLVLVW